VSDSSVGSPFCPVVGATDLNQNHRLTRQSLNVTAQEATVLILVTDDLKQPVELVTRTVKPWG
jgi:predicted secreted protein